MKKFLCIVLFFLFITSPSEAVFEFVSKIGCNAINCVGTEDFDSLALWEAATDNAGDITDGTVKCGAWDTLSAAKIANAAAVTWDEGGSGGTLISMTNHSGTDDDMYMIDVTSGSLADDDVITDGTNTITINGTPDSCIITAEVYNDDGNLTDTAVDIGGCTSSDTNYRKITVPEGERHDGTADSGVYWIATANNQEAEGLFDIREKSVIIEWLSLARHTSNAPSANIAVIYYYNPGATQTSVIRNVIISQALNDNEHSMSGIHILNGLGGTFYIYNTIVYGIENEALHWNWGNGGDTLYAYNSVIDGKVYWGDGDGTVACRNLLSFNDPGTPYDYCDTLQTSGADTTAGSPDGLDSLTIADVFVDPSNETLASRDYHLKAGSAAIDAGTDLATGYGIEIDIDGYNRDSGGVTWDVGADEYIAPAGGGTAQAIFFTKNELELVCFPDTEETPPQERGKCKYGHRIGYMLKGLEYLQKGII
jgi:hypothetical protein